MIHQRRPRYSIDKLKLIVAFVIILITFYSYYQFMDVIQVVRVSILLIGSLLTVGIVFTTKLGRSTWNFVKSAHIEQQKIVWPNRMEAVQVTVMVVILTIVLSLMIWLFDSLSLYAIYDLILNVRT